MNEILIKDSDVDIGDVVCIMFSATNGATVKDATDKFWQLTCPCGVTDTFPLNGLPEIDTPMSCGEPNHWAVKYQEEPGI